MRLLESPTHAPGVTARLHQVALLPTRAVTLSLNTKALPKCLLWPARQPLLKQPPTPYPAGLWLPFSSPLLSSLRRALPQPAYSLGCLRRTHSQPSPTPEYWHVLSTLPNAYACAPVPEIPPHESGRP